MNALGIYLLISLSFVIGTMIEFALVLCINRIDFKRIEKSCLTFNIKQTENSKAPAAAETMNGINKEKIRYVTDTVDFLAFCIFNLSFLVFNIVYFDKWSGS